MKSLICYACASRATSREHVPPQCLFPEAKDVFGRNFKKDLITVPSCEEHNLKKSHDDEFLMISLAGIFGNNEWGGILAKTKINRAIRRKSNDYLTKFVLRNLQFKEINSGNAKIKVMLGRPDSDRLTRCFESIARGLFFHEYNNVFNGNIVVRAGFIFSDDKTDNTITQFIREYWKVGTEKKDIKGSNPEIFTYEFRPADQYGIIALKVVFYQFAEVYMALHPTGSLQPFDLGFQLMLSGVPTTYKIGDQEFHFNSDNN